MNAFRISRPPYASIAPNRIETIGLATIATRSHSLESNHIAVYVQRNHPVRVNTGKRILQCTRLDVSNPKALIGQLGLRHYATSPSGFSTRSLKVFINSAPSAPSIARWSKLPVADMMVAIASASSTI